MRRKFLVLLLTLTAAAACSFGLAACGDKCENPESAQPFNAESAYKTAASLGYDGTEQEFNTVVYSDKTSEVSDVSVNSSGELIVTFTDGSYVNLGVIETSCAHTYTAWTTGILPNCTSMGYNTRECTKCGDIDYEFIPAVGHKTDMSGHDRMFHSFTCSACGQYIEEEHKFEETTCSVCGYVADYTLGLKYEFNSETQSYTVVRSYDWDHEGTEEVVIPDVYKKYPVTAIGEDAFLGCGFRSITIPESVTQIGRYAFRQCANLESIVIPQGVTQINMNTFLLCSKLTSVTLPDNLQAIGNNAFTNCTALKSISIPDSVKTLGINAFMSCKGLQSVKLPAGLTEIAKHLFVNCESLTSIDIPESVETIGTRAFWNCSSLQSVVLPEKVTVVPDYAFPNCTSLSSVTLGSEVTTLGDYAFYGCTSLSEITLPSSLTAIGYSAFSGCTSLKEVTLPSNLTDIGGYAFSGCSALEKIAFGEGVTTLDAGILKGCTSLNELVLPESLNLIKSGALVSCDNLTVITFNGTMAQWKAIQKESGWRTADNIITNLSVTCSDGVLEYIW